MNLIFTFGVHDDHHFAPQDAKCHPAGLAVVHTIILEGKRRAREDLFGVGEVQTTALARALPFWFVPSAAHCWYYAYNRAYVNT
jgi:hypothetical protein